MTKTFSKITVVSLITVVIFIMIALPVSATVDMNQEKYQDSNMWSDPNVYSPEEINMNNRANFNIVQYMEDLRKDSGNYGFPEDTKIVDDSNKNDEPKDIDLAKVDIPTSVTSAVYSTPTPKPTLVRKRNVKATSKTITTLISSKNSDTISAGWNTQGLTKADKIKVWKNLNNLLKVNVWKKLAQADQVEILESGKDIKWFPIDTACLQYGKKDMISLWEAIQLLDNDYAYEAYFGQLCSVSDFDKYRIATYLNDYDIEDRDVFIEASGYEVNNNKTYEKLIPAISAVSKSVDDVVTLLCGNAVLFESARCDTVDAETLANCVIQKVTPFVTEYKEGFPEF